MKSKLIIYIFLFSYSILFSQIRNYSYERELTGISNTWHKIILPDEIYGKISHNFSDIRIAGINKDNDTIETPYIIRQTSDILTRKEIQFKLINQSWNQNGYYFSFEIPSKSSVNQIVLDFKQQNFDWRLRLEGSQDQREWFTLTENYRILSIENNLTNYKFTTISFPNSEYKYFRIMVRSNEKPDLLSAKIFNQETVPGTYKTYSKNTNISDDRKLRQTIIQISLPMPVPVSDLKIFVQNKYDYYRPVEIMYLSDSVKTQNGWVHNYYTITSGTLSSLESNEFKFENIISNKFKAIISNYDNQPLNIDSVSVKGNIYELLVRFTEDARYYLVYGNPGASKPQYDIYNFTSKIPQSLTEILPGKELKINKAGISGTSPLFQNKAWLWGIMVIIIAILGWFSFSMMKKR